MTIVIVNIGGEGEIADAINLNNLIAPLRPPEEILRAGVLILHDMLKVPWPFADDSVDEVVGNNVPGFSAAERHIILREASRILKPKGLLYIHSMSLDLKHWVRSIEKAGFDALGYITKYGRGYAAGAKP